MEIFVNQGRDSTIEPAYLAEKKQVTSEPNLIALDVTPTSEAQTITPESPVDGYSSVSVSAVTSAIDQNIVAGNIKKDVEILGVTGSYEGSGAETFEVVLNTTDMATFTPNKTFAETVTAIRAGKAIVMKMHAEAQGQTVEVVMSCFYNYTAVSRGEDFVIYVPIFYRDNAVDGYVWDGTGFGTSSFNGVITITPV